MNWRPELDSPFRLDAAGTAYDALPTLSLQLQLIMPVTDELETRKDYRTYCQLTGLYWFS